MAETQRRREIQTRYNADHGITPESILKPVDDSLISMCDADYLDVELEEPAPPAGIDMSRLGSMEEVEREIVRLEKRMKKAAADLDFEDAASLRDQIAWLRKHAVFS